MILDTQYLGALADGDEAARAKVEELDEEAVPTRIPTVVLWEAYTGIGDAASEEVGGQLRELKRTTPAKSVDSRSDADSRPEGGFVERDASPVGYADGT